MNIFGKNMKKINKLMYEKLSSNLRALSWKQGPKKRSQSSKPFGEPKPAWQDALEELLALDSFDEP